MGRVCIREVHVADPDESLIQAARRMRDVHVGTLMVVDGEGRPVGMLTDRDVAMRCVAEGCDPAATPVGSAMTVPVTTALESTPIEEGIARMAGVPARRLVVVDADERLVGLLALDDVLELLVDEMETIGRLLRRAGPR